MTRHTLPLTLPMRPAPAVLATALALAALPAAAWADGPTWAGIKAATWSQVTVKEHPEAGAVSVLTAMVGGVECFAGKATTDVPYSALIDVVTDVNRQPGWSSAGLRDTRLLQSSGDKMYYYQVLDVPDWTFTNDRFWFLEGTVQRAQDSASLVWSRIPARERFPEALDAVLEANPSAVELPINVGAWVFDKAASGGSDVSYYVCTTTGGNVPSVISNAASRQTLPDTVGDVIREARKRLR